MRGTGIELLQSKGLNSEPTGVNMLVNKTNGFFLNLHTTQWPEVEDET